MKTKINRTRSTPVVRRRLQLVPGKQGLAGFLKDNSYLFNITQIEKLTKIPDGQLRHICVGSKIIEDKHFERLRKSFLPYLCQFALLLQDYGDNSDLT